MCSISRPLQEQHIGVANTISELHVQPGTFGMPQRSVQVHLHGIQA